MATKKSKKANDGKAKPAPRTAAKAYAQAGKVAVAQEKGRKQSERITLGLYLLLAITIVAYALLGNALIGLFAVAVIVVLFYYEIKHSVKEEGAKRSFIDIASAIGFAAVVWIVLIFVLHTTAPVDVVSSCSMLPVLHRGDVVVLHGMTNVTGFISSERLPVVNVSQQQFSSMEGNMRSEFLAYYAYFNGDKSEISDIFSNGTSYGVGLYNIACLSTTSPSDYSRCYSSPSAQGSNLIKYNYSLGKVSAGGKLYDILYTSSITIGNVTVPENYSNPVVVYKTIQNDSFGGSIIHRLVAAIDVNGTYYFLTKGDNNPALDIEFGNYPAAQSDIVGYKIADVPVLGYVKLLISGQLVTPAGCNQTILR